MPDVRHRERGRQRREALLRAALDVIGARGVRGTTHRAVAEAAGMPVATTTYYFSSLDDLLESALRLFVDDEIARLRRLGEALGGAEGTVGEVVEAVARELVRVKAHATPHAVAQFELYVEASRRPALRDAVAGCLAAYRELAEGLLRAAGCPDAEVLAPVVVALTDGLGIHDVAVGEPGREARTVDGLRRLLRASGVDLAARYPVVPAPGEDDPRAVGLEDGLVVLGTGAVDDLDEHQVAHAGPGGVASRALEH
jgi:TetR/AcrR family transcriptional regulator, regulator of biofilm formation and stress response